jgi:hypothetical protein
MPIAHLAEPCKPCGATGRTYLNNTPPTMRRSLPALILLLATGPAAKAQCAIDLPADTVTIYWGYDPLACVTLAPTVNGAAPTTVAWSNGDTAATITVCDQTSSWYFATMTDDTLCSAIDSVFVNVVDVHCGNNNNKVLVCHIPPGNPDNAHTICISENGVPAHLAHGCHLGACAVVPDSSNMDDLVVQVSPNPMAEAASVRVRSHADQRVQLNLVDAMGRRMVVLLNADMKNGEERTFWLDQKDAPTNASVMWLEAISTGGRQARQIVLVH